MKQTKSLIKNDEISVLNMRSLGILGEPDAGNISKQDIL